MAEKARVKKQQLSSDSCVVVKIYRLTAASDRQRGKQLTFACKKSLKNVSSVKTVKPINNFNYTSEKI